MWCRLGEVCDYGKCENIEASELKADDWILDLEDIEKDSGKIITFHSFAERKSESTKHIFRKGDLLYSKLRPYLNKVVIAPKDGFCTSEILPLNFNGVLLNEFAQRLLMSSFFLSIVNMLVYGVKMPRLGRDDAKKIFIPLPPLSEQHRIVVKIETIFAQIDLLAQNKADLQTVVKHTKSKILDLAIRGKLVPQDTADEPASVMLEKLRAEKEAKIAAGEIKRSKNDSHIYKNSTDNCYYEKFDGKSDVCIDNEIPFELPANWQWQRGKEIFCPMTTKIPSGHNFRYIDIDAIDNKTHRIRCSKLIEVSKAPSRASREVQNGDILFSLVRPYLKNIALVLENYSDCIASTGFYVCRPNKTLISKYAFYMMTSQYVVNGLNKFMKGDNSPSITGDNIIKWLYPLPPISEQKRIVTRIGEIFNVLDDIQRDLI